jgi:hypothetical protein
MPSGERVAAPAAQAISKEWLAERLAKGDDGDCRAGAPWLSDETPSCLCCGHIGERKVWKIDAPETYVCTACHEKANAPAPAAQADGVHPDHLKLLRPFMSERDGRLSHSLTVYLKEMADPEFRERMHKARVRLYQQSARAEVQVSDAIRALRTALDDIAHSKPLTATSQQFANELQKMAKDALSAERDPRSYPAPPDSANESDKRLAGLRALCGCVENGSDAVVTIFQDDATREWCVKVGSKTFVRSYGASMGAAIDAAIQRARQQEAE